MARVTWTDPPPVDGTTALTAAMWEQLKSDLVAQLGEVAGAPGNIDADNIVDGAVTGTKMAAGNRYVVQAIPMSFAPDVILAGVSIGVVATVAVRDFLHGTAKAGGDIIGVDWSADAVSGGAVDCTLLVNGAPVGSTDTLAISGNPQTVEHEYGAGIIVVTDGDTLGLRIVRNGGVDGNVVMGAAIVYYRRSLA